MKTRITEMFGIEFPIICGAMMWICKPNLCAAISNAGGMNPLGLGRRIRDLAADGTPFDANDVKSGLGEEGSIGQAVVAGADDDRLVFAGHLKKPMPRSECEKGWSRASHIPSVLSISNE